MKFFAKTQNEVAGHVKEEEKEKLEMRRGQKSARKSAIRAKVKPNQED